VSLWIVKPKGGVGSDLLLQMGAARASQKRLQTGVSPDQVLLPLKRRLATTMVRLAQTVALSETQQSVGSV
jgi:hypothetical protein